MHETGYVKQKDCGGSSPQRLRGIVPNSVALRLLSNITFLHLDPGVDVFSVEHGMKERVLGGGRGGQPLDIAATAQMVLQLGRDRDDLAAVGQLDVRNYHDSFDRMQIYNSLRRRNISRQ